MSKHQLTQISGNIKTGPIPVSRSSRDTCPATCPLKGDGGCYGEGGNCRFHWDRLDGAVYASVTDHDGLCAEIAALDPECVSIWRHNELGDLRPEAPDSLRIDRESAEQLCQANALGGSRGGFTYTHRPVLTSEKVSEADAAHNREIVATMNREGFTVNLSANAPSEVDALTDLGIGPVVTVLPIDAPKVQKTEAGRPIVTCPAATERGTALGITCETCGLCQIADRKIAIGFPAHGARKRKLSESIAS